MDIKTQTQTLSNQVNLLEQLQKRGNTEKYLEELEKYELMLKGADFSIRAQAASKKWELTRMDKIFAPKINWATKQINEVNKRLEARNKK